MLFTHGPWELLAWSRRSTTTTLAISSRGAAGEKGAQCSFRLEEAEILRHDECSPELARALRDGGRFGQGDPQRLFHQHRKPRVQGLQRLLRMQEGRAHDQREIGGHLLQCIFEPFVEFSSSEVRARSGAIEHCRACIHERDRSDVGALRDEVQPVAATPAETYLDDT